MSLIGWFGAPTTSAQLLSDSPALDAIWWLDPASGRWVGDARALPAALRPLIRIDRGTGLLVAASRATEIRVPLP